MSLVSLHSLGLALGAPLFSSLDFSIERGDRIGLVAANGRGKSTLLRALAGSIEPTEGRIQMARGTRVALMRQDVDDRALRLPARDVLAAALPEESRAFEEWRVDVALAALALPEELGEKPLAALSGGRQRIVLFAAAAIAEPDLLLLDEPTNHLDLQRIGQLERMIGELPRETALLVASHDRAFLDAVTTRTLFLRESGSIAYAAPYAAARAHLDAHDAAIARRHETDLRQAAQLRRQAAKLNNLGVNSGSDLLTVKTKQLKARAERIETAARPAHRDDGAGRIRLDASGTGAKVLVAFDALPITAPDGRRLFTTGRLFVRPGDRIVLLGANGAGKSRFLGRIVQALAGDADPRLMLGPSIVPGIIDQQLSHLGAAETLLGALLARLPIGEQRARSLLAGAGFPVERLGERIAVLSGGQKARLAMLVLRLEKPNLYLLDEPTNHLDIDGRVALEAELTEGEAAALVVSHDRRFVEAVGNRFWLLARGKLAEIEDPAAYFRAVMAEE